MKGKQRERFPRSDLPLTIACDNSIVPFLQCHSGIAETPLEQVRTTPQNSEPHLANIIETDCVQRLPTKFNSPPVRVRVCIFCDPVFTRLQKHLNICGLQSNDPRIVCNCRVQEAFLSTPAEMGSPSWLGEPLCVHPFGQTLPSTMPNMQRQRKGLPTSSPTRNPHGQSG